ncbi:cilia- and flagella-associated protein 251-like [Impatiens glandulifera]|uniref:cilia- and flagella-associated protein 251-like n=1 Tax=Impatiens glandulifera TaxID=253017 RepID=UPI001FB12AAC|nr:cilia- and flagella-associated protein 251-like [Impatiens glandulifera]
MTTHGKQPNVGGKERTGTSPTVPRRVVSAAAQPKTNVKPSSSTVSRNLKPTEKSPALNRGRSFDNKSTPSNASLQKSHSTIGRTTKTSPVPKPLLKSSQKTDVVGRSVRPGIGTGLNKKVATNSSIVSNRKVKPLDVVKAPVVAEEKNHDDEINGEEEVVVEENNEGLIAIVDSDREDDEQQQHEDEEEEEEVIDDETSTTPVQMGEEKEEQINIEEQSESKIETSTDHDDLPMDEGQEQISNIQEQSESNIETGDHLLPIGEEEQINIEKQSENETETETNVVPPPMVEEEEIKIDDPNHEDQEKEKEGEIENERDINPEETKQEEEEKQKQEAAEQVKEESPPQEGGGEKFLKASEIRKLMEAQSSGKDLTSSATSSPRQLVRGSSGINRGSFNKKESPVAGAGPAPAAYNEVIEETASKLLAEKRRNKVLALAGAFETVISLQQD